MRKAIAILLLFSVMVRPFTQAYYLIDYQLRQDFIAKVLCINKEKPQLHCNGKCYLAKRLKATEEKENKTQRSILEKYEIPTIICQEVTSPQFNSVMPDYTLIADTYQNHYTGLFASYLFHPPCQA